MVLYSTKNDPANVSLQNEKNRNEAAGSHEEAAISGHNSWPVVSRFVTTILSSAMVHFCILGGKCNNFEWHG